ncbi:transport and Golgi organization protein 6 homolog [Onychostruthus taczanowskii]|uniref:transport and Golgi organization protein 6 homolog n=1 Tax=Onychostruthus taczanowskii TaxID=356909 RepID=UPI001B80E794|nr:transport and Golgi organization protein 6 homolog [Onychostruthus taczanowskii]
MAALPDSAPDMAGGAQPGPEPARVVEALELLLGPPSDGGSAAEPGREPALCPETLRRNALALEERLGTRGARLFAAVAALVELARLPALGAPLLARHLRLLLCGLCGLGHGPAALCQGVSEAERAQCREALRDILDRVYQPLAVQELLVLQGQPKQRCPGAGAAPAWLRRLCGHLLSERLLRPGGVQAVVRGVLEGTDGGAGAEAAALDWRKCDAVGKILAACPQQCLSLEDYYRQVCPQILDLLHMQDKVAARQFQRVATTTLLSMAREQPELAERHLLQPLLAPLRRCCQATELALQDLTAGAVLVPEAELGSCVEDVLKVYVVGNDSSSLLLGSLQPVLGVVFSLYSFAKQNVSYLRSPCQDILLWFLEKAEREQSLAVLESLAGLSSHVPTLHPQCQLRVGSEGGAAIVLEETISDEDEALYQKISLEQCHVESLVELLSHCQKSGLAGDFFIHCLKELTQVAAEDEEAPNPAVEPGGSLLELEQYQARQGRRLLVLQLVAALCEGVSDTVFTDIVQVQEFLGAVLQRACAHPARGPGAAAEAQTLAMAMGLVAAVLGGAVQLKSSDFAVLKRLVPLLEELSRTYPEPLTQELASDLRIAILTHGACSPGTLGTAADAVLGRTAGTAARSPGGTAARSPGGTAAQSPAGTATQSPGGTAAQSPGGTAAQSPGGTAARSPGGTAAQSPGGTAAQSPGGTAARSPGGTAARSPAGTAPRPPAPHHGHGSPSARRERSKEQSTGREPGASPAPGADSPAPAGLQELLVSAYDPQPPSRAAALRRLASLVTQRDPEALRLQEKLLQVFLENVQHEDAFVYLSAIQGIALLSSEYPERILPVLLAQYECPAQGREDTMATVTRMKLGEVLMRVTRALGDMVFQHREPLIHAFLRGARDPDGALRASSLSNLGELCQHLGFQLGSIIQEVTCCVTAIARSDPEAEVRRAAVHVVVLLLRGLSEKVTEVLRDVLRDLYRLLKHVAAAERDAATLLHAQLALQELDAAVRRVLFPPQTLEKKIVVLP